MIAVWEYGVVACLYFLEGKLAYFWGIERYSFGGIARCLVSGVLEVFSAVESGINGPDSRPDHRHRSAHPS